MRAHHVDGHAHVLGVRSHLHQRETHRIRAVTEDDVARVHAVAEALGHLLAVAVLDHGVNEHVGERYVAVLEVAVEHHHAADPQRDDLPSRAQ